MPSPAPSPTPSSARPATSAVRVILVATALLLPSLSLIPLGGLYLWEKGLLLWWALAATAVVLIVSLAQRWLLAEPEIRAAAAGPGDTSADEPTESSLEDKAWSDVKAISDRLDIDRLRSLDDVFALGLETVSAVARRIHPERPDAVWRFTVPEALAITERVSRRLKRYTIENVPFGDRLTVAQVLVLYRWRVVADVAERAFEVWRLLRLANPVTAVTHEAREKLSRALVQWGREHVTRRLAEAYVEEVGRAAIDLYGGRLRTSPQEVLPPDFPEEPARSQKGAGRQALSAAGSLVKSVLPRRWTSSSR